MVGIRSSARATFRARESARNKTTPGCPGQPKGVPGRPGGEVTYEQRQLVKVVNLATFAQLGVTPAR
jgi:hypothetical protein